MEKPSHQWGISPASILGWQRTQCCIPYGADRKSTRLNSSHSQISYAVFCLKKKKNVHVDLRALIKIASSARPLELQRMLWLPRVYFKRPLTQHSQIRHLKLSQLHGCTEAD